MVTLSLVMNVDLSTSYGNCSVHIKSQIHGKHTVSKILRFRSSLGGSLLRYVQNSFRKKSQNMQYSNVTEIHCSSPSALAYCTPRPGHHPLPLTCILVIWSSLEYLRISFPSTPVRSPLRPYGPAMDALSSSLIARSCLLNSWR